MCAGQKWMTKNKVTFQVKNFHDSLNLGRSAKASTEEIPPEKLQFLEANLATILEEKLNQRKRAQDLITYMHREEEHSRVIRRPQTRFSELLRFRHAKTKDSRNIPRKLVSLLQKPRRTLSSPRPCTSQDTKTTPLSFSGPTSSLRQQKIQEQRFFEGGQDELNELCETYPVSRKEAFEMYSQFNSLRLMEGE